MSGTAQRILIVDDVEDMLDLCAETLGQLENVEVLTERDARRAAERIREEAFDALVCDIRMAGLDGVALLKIAREHDPHLQVVMLTGHPTMETAVECLKLGAADYITKPVNPDDLLVRVKRCLDERRLREEHSLLRRQVEREYAFSDLVGDSSAMKEVLDVVGRVAATDVDVLIHGETGTGKELIARAIHQGSKRRARPLVPVDCGAIPENLLESEFFGYEKGAFTGAAARSIGLLEFAAGGTLFLDELGELPPLLQSKLLRALQERKIRRLGGKQEITIDTRIVAATGRNLEKMIEQGTFRQDLYYRINVVTINLPALRERGQDVLLLAEHFRQRFARELGKPVTGFAPDALAAMLAHRWPGNVRELQNAVRRGIALTRGSLIGLADLPPQVIQSDTNAAAAAAGAAQAFAAGAASVTNAAAAVAGPVAIDASFADARARAMGAFERDYLSGLLRLHGGDVVRAMQHAGVSRASFYRMLRAHGLRAAEFRGAGSAAPAAATTNA